MTSRSRRPRWPLLLLAPLAACGGAAGAAVDAGASGAALADGAAWLVGVTRDGQVVFEGSDDLVHVVALDGGPATALPVASAARLDGDVALLYDTDATNPERPKTLAAWSRATGVVRLGAVVEPSSAFIASDGQSWVAWNAPIAGDLDHVDVMLARLDGGAPRKVIAAAPASGGDMPLLFAAGLRLIVQHAPTGDSPQTRTQQLSVFEVGDDAAREVAADVGGSVGLDRGGTRAVFLTVDRQVTTVDPAGGGELRFEGPASSALLSPDGRTVVYALDDGRVRSSDAGLAAPITLTTAPGALVSAASPRFTWLLLGDPRGPSILDAAHGGAPVVFAAPDARAGGVLGDAFSADEAWLLYFAGWQHGVTGNAGALVAGRLADGTTRTLAPQAIQVLAIGDARIVWVGLDGAPWLADLATDAGPTRLAADGTAGVALAPAHDRLVLVSGGAVYAPSLP